jgi:hypothetical protein
MIFREFFAIVLSIKKVTLEKRNVVGFKFGRRSPTNQFKPELSNIAS